MSKKCIACVMAEDQQATPARAALLVIGLVRAESIDKMIAHLCIRHRRSLDSALATSTAMAKKLMS
jgi:hypothetical protein